jgi:hypothetical protein
MSFRCLIISVVLLFLTIGNAYGDSVIIRPKKGLLLLGDLYQWLGTTYQYREHSSTHSSNSTHQLEESYHFETAAAILDPHILNLFVSAELKHQQDWLNNSASDTTSGSGLRYEYSFAANAYDNSWYPINAFSSISFDTVVSPFSPPIDTESGRHGIEFQILKKLYRLKFKYERNSLDLNGAGQSSSQTADSFEFDGNHNFRDFFYTSAGVSYALQNSVSGGKSQKGNSLLANITNDMYLGRLKNYVLTSNLQSSNNIYAGLPQEALNLTETLTGNPGKALDFKLEGRYDHNRTRSVEGAPDELHDITSGSFQIRHQLFESLTTSLRGNIFHSSFLSGSQDRYSGTLEFKYRKKLTDKTTLFIGTYGTHEVTDRKQVVTDEGVVNERTHSVSSLNQVITLDNPGPLREGSVTIQGFTVAPINSLQTPDILFVENVDYIIDYPLGRITWIGFPLPTVPNLVISYTVLFDPSVKYSTDTSSISSTLSMANGKYQLSGLYYRQDQSLISGQSQLGLYNSSYAQARFQGFLDENIYSLEFDDYNLGPTKYRYLEGLWQYNHVNEGSLVQFMVKDRYSMYDATHSSSAYNSNNFNASATYSRDLTYWSRLLLSSIFLDNRGGRSGSSDAISIRASLQARFNRLTVKLLGSSGWKISGRSTDLDNFIRLEIKRDF